MTAQGVTQGTLNNLAMMQNINYYDLPRGVREWYKIINASIRVRAKFFLPVSVIKNLDLTLPVYINDLGGFYIIEEISEYTNSSTAVNVRLIKLIDNLKES
jgi:hypothetical protein